MLECALKLFLSSLVECTRHLRAVVEGKLEQDSPSRSNLHYKLVALGDRLANLGADESEGWHRDITGQFASDPEARKLAILSLW